MKKLFFIYKKILFSLGLLFILVLGRNVSILGYVSTDTSNQVTNSVYNFISSATGGDFSTLSLFSLGIGPYMSALIIWTAISMSDLGWIKDLSNKGKGYIQRVLTLFFAIMQGITYASRFEKMSHFKSPFYFLNCDTTVQIVLILIAGSMFLSWLSDMNNENGIGGQSLFILPSIIGNIPSMLISGQSKKDLWTAEYLAILAAITVFYVIITIFLYRSEYRLRVERIGVTSFLTKSYIPIKLLTAGAMPFMFAVSIFSLPSLLLLNSGWNNTMFSYILSRFFIFNSIEGIITYGVVIYLLALGFSFINFRPYDIAKNLRDTGDYIFNIFPGRDTEKFLNRKLLSVSFFGNTYLVLVSIIPLFIGLKYPMVTNLAFYFGSIFMLIIIIDNLVEELSFMKQISKYNILNKV